MARRRPRWNRISRYLSYSVGDAAHELDVSRGTIRRWIKVEGLAPIGGGRQILLQGQTIKEFGNSRSKKKVKCCPDEFYCFRCKAPRRPAGNMADFHPRNAKTGNLKALCEACATVMNKHASASQLPALRLTLDISIQHRPEHLNK